MNDRILIQDALKHIVEREYDEQPASARRLSIELSITATQVERLFADLEAAGLLTREGEQVTLTEEGREYAMHVLRAHRLYETYLARKTGVGAEAWHKQANVKEHELSHDQVTELARQLGNPSFDPHGDPIPDAAGEMPPKRGKPLSTYPVGWAGRVVHVEDEPPVRYARIVAAGIAPGTVLRVAATEAADVRIQAEGCAFAFPREVAEQITVEPLGDGEQFDESLRRLASLVDGEKGQIVRLSPLCGGLERGRLLDLGIVPGTVVEQELVSPSGSPVAYRVRGAAIALRREQAEKVLIRVVKE